MANPAEILEHIKCQSLRSLRPGNSPVLPDAAVRSSAVEGYISQSYKQIL